MTEITYRGGPIFDGQRLLHGFALRCTEGRVTALAPEAGWRRAERASISRATCWRRAMSICRSMAAAG